MHQLENDSSLSCARGSRVTRLSATRTCCRVNRKAQSKQLLEEKIFLCILSAVRHESSIIQTQQNIRVCKHSVFFLIILAADESDGAEYLYPQCTTRPSFSLLKMLSVGADSSGFLSGCEP